MRELTPAATRPLLIVEDSDEDYTTIVRLLRKHDVANPLARCVDGDEVLDFLHQRGTHAAPSAAPRPCVILLDLNLPGLDGRTVLEAIKGDVSLRTIPVIVLTSSTDARDVGGCYRAGANSYLVKPVNLPQFTETIQHFADYWLRMSLLPEGNQ